MAANRRAFTLLELLLGVTVTTLIGLSAVTVGSTLSSRYAKSEEYYSNLQTARVGMGTMQSLVRGAQLVTQASSTQVLLWKEANNGDGQLNPSELVLLNISGGTVKRDQIMWGTDWLSQLFKLIFDQPVSLGTVVENFNWWSYVVDNSIITQSRTVANGVSSLNISLDVAPPMSRKATITITCGTGKNAVTLRSTASLRGDRTGCVATVGGHYALVNP
jgi:hypothetical protein